MQNVDREIRLPGADDDVYPAGSQTTPVPNPAPLDDKSVTITRGGGTLIPLFTDEIPVFGEPGLP